MWEVKTIKTLDSIYDNSDELKQTWSICRKVNEEENKKYARELCRTVFYTKNGEHKSFPVTITMADFNWILANKDLIKAELSPTPKATVPVATTESIEEVPF